MAEADSFTPPTDAFVEILLRLPTSSRRRFRLVCKRWRDVIDERTSERQVRSKILAFISGRRGSRALVLDDGGFRRRHEWTYKSSSHGVVGMVGTANGLICLRDSYGDATISAITVANPITGETKVLPRVPTIRDPFKFCYDELCSFGYHPTTGRYKVVQVQSSSAMRQDRVHVFTLGADTAWWEVVVPSSVA